MTDHNNIQDELRDLNSDLPANSGKAPFAVPDGYFDGLAAGILAKAKAQDNAVAQELAELSPLLASLSKAMPYELPKEYFGENLSGLPFLFSEEESAVLTSVGKALPYEVSANYFEELPGQILARLRQPERKVIPLFSTHWVRMAAAAIVVGVIFMSGYQYFNQSRDTSTASQQAADSSANWVAKSDRSFFSDLKKVSKEDLEDFIQAVPLQPAATQQNSSASIKRGEIEHLLKGVSKKEIDNFLDQLPNVDDDLAIIN